MARALARALSRVYSTSTDVETSEFASVVFIDVVWFKEESHSLFRPRHWRESMKICRPKSSGSDEKWTPSQDCAVVRLEPPCFIRSRHGACQSHLQRKADIDRSLGCSSVVISSNSRHKSTSLTCVKKPMLFTRAILIALAIALLNWFAVNPLRRDNTRFGLIRMGQWSVLRRM